MDVADKKPNIFVRVLKWIKSNFIPMKTDSKKDVITKILLDVCIVVFIISVIWLLIYYQNKSKTDDLNSKLQGIYSSSEEEPSSVPIESEDGFEGDHRRLKSFRELYLLNNEIVGWIEIKDSAVNLPVMQTKDNSYYLSHDFEGNKTVTGSIFADYRYPVLSDDRADNIVIYGHNTTDGTFFGALHQYKNIKYFKENPIIDFDTLYQKDQYKIFACFLTNTLSQHDDGVVFDYHNKILFNNQDDFDDFYSNVMKRSYYLTGIDVEYGDELITLSTCDHTIKDGRFVIVARKLREGESAETDASKVIYNPNLYMPLVWYEVTKQDPPR